MSPVSPALAENLAAEVVGHYQEAERTLLARISRNLAKGIDGPHWAEQKYTQLLAYQRQTERLIADLAAKSKTGVDTAITTAYERGGLSAVADMNAMGVVPVEHLAGLRAVEAMAAETLGYVNATHPRILRSTMDAYRAAIEAGSKQAFVGSMERVAASEAARTIVAEQGTQVLLGATTRRQATQAALNAFAKKGITGFVDKSGRGWNLESYVETAMRTGCGNAAVQGHVDRLVENGLDLVIVSDAPRECPLCRPWEGKVLSIGGVPVEMPEGTDPAFQVAAETPGVASTPAPEWQPEMSREDAMAWARGSAYEDRTFYHYTDAAGAEGIRRDGFNLSDGSYGSGIYLTDNAAAEGIGRRWATESLECMVRSEHPLEFDGLTALHKWEAESMLADEEFDAAVKRLGHDALRIHFKTRDPYTILFDKRRVVVVKKP